MRPGIIRPIAICIFKKEDELLVGEGYDSIKQQTFYRPLGGTIEFGEASRQTIIRELREELGATVTDLRYLATLENIFIYNGQPGHEIVFVYEGRLAEPSFYERAEFTGYEDTGLEFKIKWQSLEMFRRGEIPLYPTGLLELLAEDGF